MNQNKSRNNSSSISKSPLGSRQVEVRKEGGGFRVFYGVLINGKGPEVILRTFMYNTSSFSKEKRKGLDMNVIGNLVRKVFRDKTDQGIWDRKNNGIKSELGSLVNKISRSVNKFKFLKEYGAGKGIKFPSDGKHHEDTGSPSLPYSSSSESVEESSANKPSNETSLTFHDPIMPSKSMFACEKESANTKVFLAPSFSGKTTLCMMELNKLSTKQLDEYDKIILFTESKNAAPLKKLKKEVVKKMVVYDCFVPQFILILKKINNISENRFRFLIILDDCIDLKGGILVKMILTLRNANISTVISVQYSKLLAKSQRQSIHDYYLINLKPEELEYLMSGFLAPHFRNLFEEEGLASKEEISKMNYKKLADRAMERLKDKILHFDQRHDDITIYSRPKVK